MRPGLDISIENQTALGRQSIVEMAARRTERVTSALDQIAHRFSINTSPSRFDQSSNFVGRHGSAKDRVAKIVFQGDR